MIASHLSFRKATGKDWEVVSALEKAVGSRLYKPILEESEVQEYLRRSSVYLLLFDGQIIGTISYRRKGKDQVEIDGLTVHPRHQGLGHASAAMAWLMEKIKHYRK